MWWESAVKPVWQSKGPERQTLDNEKRSCGRKFGGVQSKGKRSEGEDDGMKEVPLSQALARAQHV
jgi:hypothetical protein